ncbi:hypothetical protein BLOT_008098 [Blomia tropicalis]|nr:hypothetical protein BLOT_008098 [Blomia tropicalis]
MSLTMLLTKLLGGKKRCFIRTGETRLMGQSSDGIDWLNLGTETRAIFYSLHSIEVILKIEVAKGKKVSLRATLSFNYILVLVEKTLRLDQEGSIFYSTSLFPFK